MQSGTPRTKALSSVLETLVRAIQDGRFLRMVFFVMLALSAGAVGYDFTQMVANAPGTLPGSTRLEPAPMELPKPGDQTRPYLPRTMPLGPSRDRPLLPGYFGPLDSAAMASPMAFFRGPDGAFSAVGTITPGTAERLADFLEENDKQLGIMHLHSPGGSVSDALAMARAIRAAGISTDVPANGYCASSCPLVLSSGLFRTAGERSWIGVHQVYAPPPATGTLQRGMSDAQTVSALCQALLVDMGVDPRLWIYAMQTPSAQLYVLTPEQISTLRLANYRQALARPTARPEA